MVTNGDSWQHDSKQPLSGTCGSKWQSDDDVENAWVKWQGLTTDKHINWCCFFKRCVLLKQDSWKMKAFQQKTWDEVSFDNRFYLYWMMSSGSYFENMGWNTTATSWCWWSDKGCLWWVRNAQCRRWPWKPGTSTRPYLLGSVRSQNGGKKHHTWASFLNNSKLKSTESIFWVFKTKLPVVLRVLAGQNLRRPFHLQGQ